ncbi:hypothetical protein B7H23_12940 [Notoacmeibacter marinus]|uniref:Uncharacterized protein n=1 Tax=Notoacmeibacter marinus TaxID=1876515 RepID=A0A231UV08_9HYPH|nr:hypothetical protein [Notoacmeibacter marinus]OXS99105.1 hypothetical protein B7H23_12940 [Notoacmeibacter marinus]
MTPSEIQTIVNRLEMLDREAHRAEETGDESASEAVFQEAAALAKLVETCPIVGPFEERLEILKLKATFWRWATDDDWAGDEETSDVRLAREVLVALTEVESPVLSAR